MNPAGFWIRFGASFLDGIIIGIPLAIISYLLLGESDTWFTTLGSYLYFILLPVFWVGYTIGKKILGIRIVNLDDTDVSFWTMIKRHLIAGILYAFTFGIGIIVSAFMVGIREDKRAIHDFIAGTYVSFNPPWQK
ncbi:RDD family protein [Psychrobacillus sp. FSL K6-2836]|uniref:RDD family protein n=1 Tax=Psychrobacillus sp. FSL K6-2836 TaxID=2921548 RepID=UPI0030F6464F